MTSVYAELKKVLQSKSCAGLHIILFVAYFNVSFTFVYLLDYCTAFVFFVIKLTPFNKHFSSKAGLNLFCFAFQTLLFPVLAHLTKQLLYTKHISAD